MSSCSLRSRWLLVSSIVLATLSPRLAEAQGPYTPAAPVSASAQLADPHAGPSAIPPVQLIDPADLELSQRSMGGPGTELVAGGLVLLWTPVVSGLIVLANGPGWFECWDEEYDDGLEQCQERVDRQRRDAQQKGIAVGVVMGLAGLGLLGHGAYRIRRIRQARKQVEIGLGELSLRRDGASFTLRATF
jgi:hypothetical protein